jgi:uncharacterized membrane protein YphA (DoxX/SURF4 family)
MAAEMDLRIVHSEEALIKKTRRQGERETGRREATISFSPYLLVSLSPCLLVLCELCGYFIPLSWYEKIPSYRDSPQDRNPYSTAMLFFSTFPGGWPGVGLLLLRAAVGGMVAVQGGVSLADGVKLKLGAWLISVSAVVCGVSLLAGFLTPFASILAGLGGVSVALSWISAPNLLDDKLSIVFVVIMTVAIFLIGPGAFSLDARIFGRREIIIPPVSPKS